MRIRSIARALTILLVGTASIATMSAPAVANNPTGVPSGVGWGAGYDFTAPGAVSYWVDLPGGVIGGTITWNAQNTATLSLNVTLGKPGPCVYGGVNDFDSGITVDIMNTSNCQVGTAHDSAVEVSPMGEYDIWICAGVTGKMCNTLTLYNLPFWDQMPDGSYAEWAYTNATHLAFAMATGSGTFSGTATHYPNGYAAVSTLGENLNSASACVSAVSMLSEDGTSRCGSGTMPLNFSASGIDLNFAYSIFGVTYREICFIANPEAG